MKFLLEILTVIFTLTYGTICLIQLAKGNIKPVLATWLFFSFAAILSVIMNYKESGFSGISANLFNLTDTIVLIVCTVFILLKKETRRTFTLFEKFCLLAVGLVFAGWISTGENVISYLAIQVMFLIAYMPTFVHLWKADKNTESLIMWVLNCVACIFGVVLPILQRDFLPTVYGVRAVLCTATVVVLILRLQNRNKIMVTSNI
jgi:hypothetical protein